MALFNKFNIYIYLPPPEESVLGKTLQEMVGELKRPIDESPKKIKYPLSRDKFGRMCKP